MLKVQGAWRALVVAFAVALTPVAALAARNQCGNDVAERREVCDGADLRGQTCQSRGYDAGVLGCTTSCSAFVVSGCYDFPPPVCGDNKVNQPTEECDGTDLLGLTCADFGYDTGALGCDGTCGYDTSGCQDLPTCGDGAVNQETEECDGADLLGLSCTDLGWDAGTLGCDGTCGLDESGCYDFPPAPVCGDGTVNQASEACDGADLGGASCLSLGHDGGALACDPTCAFDESACTDDPPPPGGCGDGYLDGFEECDGVSDAACPGACSDSCACPATTGNGELEVHVVDVGQGDGIVVVSPDGFVLVIDSGIESQGTTVNNYLASIGITGVDYTLISHLHADHLGGMDRVLTAHPEIVASFDAGGTGTSGEYLEYEAAIGTRRQALITGDFIDLGPSVTAEVLHADSGSSNENNNSVVVKLTYGNLSWLLGGDCENECEGAFDPGPIDVYKVHHHGSTTSTSEALVSAMRPDTAVISVGANNSYGHPAPATLDRLAAYGVDVWRTDLDGDVDMVAGPDWYLVNGTSQCLDGQTRACGTTDVGGCALGLETCQMGTWQPCMGAVEPIPEVCDNAVDDDCDGLEDFEEAACGPVGAPVLLSQAYYDTLGTDAIEEFVDLHNRGASPVSVAGWTLTDNGGTWTIPAGVTVPAGGFVSIARDAAGFQAHFGFLPDVSGMTLSLANTSDGVTLRDSAGVEVDRVGWEGFLAGWTIAANTGNSLVRTDPAVDTDTSADWSVRAPVSPDGGF